MRHKISVLFFALIIPIFSKAQNFNPQNHVQINWQKPIFILDSNAIRRNVLNFQSAYHNGDQSYLPSYHIQIYNEIIEGVDIVPDSSGAVSQREAELIKDIPFTSFKTKIFISYYKGKPVSNIYIVPITVSGGSYSKIHQFSYTTRSSSAVRLQSFSKKIIKKGQQVSLIHTSATNSVLSTGEWYKISINQSGVYKIDYNFLAAMGLNPGNINPKEIKIFGNGGGMLSQKNSDPRYDDLVENAIYISGEEDGKFDKGDYILFYGSGPHPWVYNSTTKTFQHVFNIYSDHTYYFFTIGKGQGLRIPEQASVNGATQTITQFDERYFFEKDNAQVMSDPIKPSGRLWIGDIFDYNLQNRYSFNTNGIIPNSNIVFKSACVGRGPGPTSFSISLNSVQIGMHKFTAFFEDPKADYPYVGEYKSEVFNLNSSTIGNTSDISILYSFNKGGNFNAKGYLDFFEIFTQRNLQIYGAQTSFRSIPSLFNEISEFELSNTSGSEMIWDITDPLFVKHQRYFHNSGKSLFSAYTSALREYVIFSPEKINAPKFESKIDNQNLHNITQGQVPDNLIITTEAFLGAANQLAEFHKSHDNLDSYVTTVQKIYNEFSSGAQDISAIRDFIKMVYDRSSPGDSLKFVTLFGDCSVDYKDRMKDNTNFVPVYESRQSLHPIFSHSSDDFYGFMDYNEGEWQETNSVKDALELGIGRLPVKTEAEAYAIVEKIKNYKTIQALGNWRNRITLIAGNKNPGSTENPNTFVESAEALAQILSQKSPQLNINKIYLPSYTNTYTPSGAICPPANDAIQNDLEKGTLILNYTGHGGEFQLSQENILNASILSSLSNKDKLPFIVAATCQFGRYDCPGLISGIEAAFLNFQGGSIGSLASTRPVYNDSNDKINQEFYKAILNNHLGRALRLGEVITLAKNGSIDGIDNRNYALIGDPALTLNFPIEEVVLTKINGNELNNVILDTLKALQKVKMEGEIRDHGKLISDYNGKLNLSIFDKASTNYTIEEPISFMIQNNIIYDGQASIKGGKFLVEFIVPKDISYQFGKGKASMYASNTSNVKDGSGSSFNFIIGGVAKNAPEDNTPPTVKAYLNDESFVFGGTTGNNPKLILKLFDENGINLSTTGIGHAITMSIDNSREVTTLNNFYSADLDSYQYGTVNYSLKDLSPGLHSIKVKVWDTYNNSSEAYIEFVVVNSEAMDLNNILNYPNPFSTNTEFHFDHNRAGDDIDVMIQVFTVSGKLIRSISNRFFSCPGHVSGIHWDGRDEFGDKIGKGVYLYKLNVKSMRDGKSKAKYQKLVILN